MSGREPTPKNDRTTVETSADESGAVIAYFALIMAVLLGVSGFVVDGGRLWNQRRALVVATDAAALAGSWDGAYGYDPCTKALEYLFINAAIVSNPNCSQTPSGRAGVVEVSAERDVGYTFASLLGIDSGMARASTAAIWTPEPLIGARPFAVCERATPDLLNWLNDTDPVELRITIRLLMAADHAVAECSANGLAPGNWGIIDFDGGNNSTGEINEWLANGYSDGIYTSDATGSCLVIPSGCYLGSPGAISTNIRPGLSDLFDLNQYVPIALYRSAESNGANLLFRFSKVISGRVTDYRVTGSNESRYIEVEFEHGLLRDGEPPEETEICGETAADCTVPYVP
jgi:hypothetical protein